MSPRRDSEVFRARQGKKRLEAQNAIRKVAIVAQDGSDWNILGYEYVDPETGDTIKEGDGDEGIPVFQGIGVFARPVGPNGQGMMLHVGNEADHPILVAVRDEDGRLAYVDKFSEIAAGEIAIFNGQGTARLLIKADGSIEINTPAGADVNVRVDGDSVQSLVKRDEFLDHFHPTAPMGPTSGPSTGGGAGPATPGVPGDFTNTKLKSGDA